MALLSQFLVRLFSLLDDAGVSYCVLRNYEELPERIGNDIDMLVLPMQVEAFENCILETAENFEWQLLKRPKRFGYRSYWFQYGTGDEFVHFDVWSLVTWKGVRWANEKAILDYRIRWKQLYIPDAASEAGILLIKDLIQNGAIKKKYLGAVQKVATEYPESFAEFLRWGLGKDLAAALSNMAGTGEWKKIEALKGRIRRTVFLRSFLHNPLEPLLGTFRFLFGHIRSMASSPDGIFVVLIGPDGSGKSSIAKGLVDSLAELFPGTHYYHGRFGLIPKLRSFLNLARHLLGRKPLPPPPSGIHAVQNVPPHGMLRASIYLLYYSIDYFLGHWIIRHACGNSQMVVFDRYFYDYFMQDLFRHLPRWFLKPLMVILPQPDLVIYLRNIPEVIHRRKSELTVEEIERQNEVCERIVKGLSYAVAVSTDPPIPEVVGEMSHHVLDIMAKRQAKRRGS